MAINKVNDNTKFIQWKDITNLLIDAIGDLTTLTTIEKNTLVGAINELNANIGNLALLTTDETTNLVGAINELDSLIDVNIADIIAIYSSIGVLANLTTDDKTSLVNAINEVDGLVNTNITNIGTNTNNIGTLSSLTTDDKSNLVNAINELDADLATQNSAYFENFDNSRFSADTGKTITTFNKGTLFNNHNSSSMNVGDKFIDDNANNGGSAGTMGADALSLLAKLVVEGRVEQRYGYEFFINKIISGSGTADPQTVNVIDYYPQTISNDKFLGDIASNITWSGYIQNMDATNLVVLGNANANLSTYIDGILQATPYELTNATGWVHVRQKLKLTQEYLKIFPAIYATAGNSTEIQVALSALYRADVNTIQLGVV